ncbi:hypothetical protein BGX28_005449, partial [Mortierella sp. GBA30]
MTHSTPTSRGTSPSRATVAGSNVIHNSHSEADSVAVSSVRQFAGDPAFIQPPHSQHQNQQQHASYNNSGYNGNIAAFSHSSNTEAASRMVAEENQQRNKLPAYLGLERFTLLEKMGDGAFSNVYKAHDTKADRIVAVKVVRKYDMSAHQDRHLHRDMKKKPRVTERANILKEVQIMRQLKHPGIIQLYDFSESDEYYFLVLELAQGGELFHRIVKLTYLSEELTRHVIVQVAQAIRYLHEEKGVIHRDIKPENILFEPIPIIPSPPGYKPSDEEDKEDEGIFRPGVGGGGIGQVKIADFGLSKVVWDEQTMTPAGEEPLQEQAEDKHIDTVMTPLFSAVVPNGFAENKILANVAAMTPDYGAVLRTPKTPYKRRAENPLSPVIGRKEVFDVSNAVHRMGEESRHRALQGYG